ncbi:MAG: hypothetical protein HC913_00615 [Microscillaceae bacterium]|nr:hypothetical protein [Microscillaceae bacterium]
MWGLALGWGWAFPVLAQAPDTVKVGVYITSLYDFNLAENAYNADLWVWFNYQNDSLTPLETMEVVNLKEGDFSLAFYEKKGGINWGTHKGKLKLKKQWDIRHFPFDKQDLEIIIEEANYDISLLRYVPDIQNSKIDKNVKLEGWAIRDFVLHNEVVTYETTYGDPTLKGKSNYARLRVNIRITRQAFGLFLKLFTGVYIAFAITLIIFFVSPESVEARFGLTVGSLFAAVGNKYIVDSILPETTTFTLVDKVHTFTFLFIFLSLITSIIALSLSLRGRKKAAALTDWAAFWFILLSYIIINLWLVYVALAS